jgi:hypothetical protein
MANDETDVDHFRNVVHLSRDVSGLRAGGPREGLRRQRHRGRPLQSSHLATILC